MVYGIDRLDADRFIRRRGWTDVIKAVPNILSTIRFLLAVVLYFVEPLSAVYLSVYAVCVITDPLDGFIARRYDACSRYGHLLDSLGDVSMAVAVLCTLIPFLDWELWEMVLIVVVIVIRLISFTIGTIKYRRPAFLHSYLNKLAGAFFFMSPFLIRILDLPVTIVITGTVCVVASVEYLYINIRNEEYDPNYRSVFLDGNRCASIMKK